MTAFVLLGCIVGFVVVGWLVKEARHAPILCDDCETFVDDCDWDAHAASHADDRWFTQHRGAA